MADVYGVPVAAHYAVCEGQSWSWHAASGGRQERGRRVAGRRSWPQRSDLSAAGGEEDEQEGRGSCGRKRAAGSGVDALKQLVLTAAAACTYSKCTGDDAVQ